MDRALHAGGKAGVTEHPDQLVGFEAVMGMSGVGVLVAAAVERPVLGLEVDDAEVGFLDLDGDSYALHDWLENNAWAAGAESRSDASRMSRMARTYPNEYKTLVEAGVKGIGKEDYESLRNVNDRQTVVERLLNDLPSPAPSPAPSPSPVPNEEENTVGPKDGPPPQRGFSGFTIYHQAGAMHISQRDFDSWERAYTNIDLRAELQKLSDWTKTTREWGKKEAFHACSAALAKKNGAAFEAHREQSRPSAMCAVN